VKESKIKSGMTHRNPTYAAMHHSLDQSVGRIETLLEELGLSKNTLVIFSSDNGGLSHKGGQPTGITMNDPLRRGKGSSYEGGTRVPFIVKWPGVIKPGGLCTEPVIGIDLYPTILDSCGISGNPTHNALVDGSSLLPLFKHPSSSLNRTALYWHYPHYHAGGDAPSNKPNHGPYAAVRSGNYKLLEFFEEGRFELYDLDKDISESKDLASLMPEKVQVLKQKLYSWRAKVKAQMMTENPDYDPAAKPVKKEKKKKK